MKEGVVGAIWGLTGWWAEVAEEEDGEGGGVTKDVT